MFIGERATDQDVWQNPALISKRTHVTRRAPRQASHRKGPRRPVTATLQGREGVHCKMFCLGGFYFSSLSTVNMPRPGHKKVNFFSSFSNNMTAGVLPFALGHRILSSRIFPDGDLAGTQASTPSHPLLAPSHGLSLHRRSPATPAASDPRTLQLGMRGQECPPRALTGRAGRGPLHLQVCAPPQEPMGQEGAPDSPPTRIPLGHLLVQFLEIGP